MLPGSIVCKLGETSESTDVKLSPCCTSEVVRVRVDLGT